MNDILLSSIPIDELKKIIQSILHEELKELNSKELLNATEVCQFLGIHRSTLNKWKRMNKIPYSKMGKRVIYKRHEVLSCLSKGNINARMD